MNIRSLRTSILALIILLIGESYAFSQDVTPPAIRCKTGLVVVLPSQGEIIVHANQFDDGSLDDVTRQEDLKFYFDGQPSKTEVTINCSSFEQAQVLGSLTTSYYFNVADEAGNVSTCEVELEVQDNKYVCGRPQLVCNGCISDWKTSDPVRARINCGNDTSGCYELIVDRPQSLKLCRNWDALNGVSTGDLVTIQRHLLDLEVFTHPLQHLAADCNNTGTVSAGDISTLRKLILGVIADFRDFNLESWIFVREIDSLNYSTDLSFNDTLNCPENTDVIAVKMGDVNDLPGIRGGVTRGNISPVVRARNTENGIEFIASESFQLSAIEIGLTVDADFFSVVNGVVPIEENHFHYNGKRLKVSWNDPLGQSIWVNQGDVLLTVNGLKTEEHASPGAVWDEYINEIPIGYPKPDFYDDFVIFPNPGRSYQRLTISHDLPIQALNIYGLHGQKVVSEVYHEDRTEILAPMALSAGIYLIEIQSTRGREVKRIVIQ